MGYDVHITRAEYWAQNEESPILLDEWIEAASSEPRLNDRGGGCFVAERIRGNGGDSALLWGDGQVYTTDPDEQTLVLMRKLAMSLRAVVQGDDGELY